MNKQNIYWQLYQEDPIIKPGFPSPILADPSFLFPESCPDGLWHLFAHNIFGVLEYVSEDGIHWKKKKSIVRNAMRPFIYSEDGTYYLYYEKYKFLHVLMSWFPYRKWKSKIEVKTSKDLVHWSASKTVIVPKFPFHKDPNFGESVSNPCLVKFGNKYRMYFSSSLVMIPDCGFCEPKYITVAEASSPLGPFSYFSDPILSPNDMDPFCNLGAGSIKVIPWKGRYLGFQNGIFWNPVRKESCSAILFLQSEDGINFERINNTPILGPTGRGWKASHVYACDVKYSEAENIFILYFNARDKAHWTKGKEAIGLFVGKVEETKENLKSKSTSKSKKQGSRSLKNKPKEKAKVTTKKIPSKPKTKKSKSK
ncbi:glycoside hydrolase, family 43 domain protein [Leptospira ellinghausenii]|uniref:Glycoside hydrolase, family 43 domain protein n=1 Tax=Leptospira ellinghausenii TaxID=1917822 RepID=A0A2P2DGQ6_9LEPT|nr:family 43 glycosylhydrolase [Leptospira ellinghausenii]GBF43798.1 glycoside hydrolase, family 43 domain protein [Leptospira ellinghausenii]